MLDRKISWRDYHKEIDLILDKWRSDLWTSWKSDVTFIFYFSHVIELKRTAKWEKFQYETLSTFFTLCIHSCLIKVLILLMSDGLDLSEIKWKNQSLVICIRQFCSLIKIVFHCDVWSTSTPLVDVAAWVCWRFKLSRHSLIPSVSLACSHGEHRSRVLPRPTPANPWAFHYRRGYSCKIPLSRTVRGESAPYARAESRLAKWESLADSTNIRSSSFPSFPLPHPSFLSSPFIYSSSLFTCLRRTQIASTWSASVS